MKFSLAWLYSHLDAALSVSEVAAALTELGLEVESVTDNRPLLAGITVAEILSTAPHPQAERLKVCSVQTADGTLEIVCGAPNARPGLKTFFAPVGTFIPGTGITLEARPIRGVVSNGMLCSEKELVIGDDAGGIVELDGDFTVGSRLTDVGEYGSPVIEIAVTANRPDCAGVRGIARDLAAAGKGTLKPLDTTPIGGSYRSPITVTLDFPEDQQSACPYFVGRYFRNVRNVQSPSWMKLRLFAAGLRPISALVDVTNYLSLDLCRPLHVFDAQKLRGGIIVRSARPGEKLLGLDAKEYELAPGQTVIADSEKAHAIGGVMGDAESGCTAETREVFLEVAYFDPQRTALTGRALGVRSEARYRFERGVDPEFLQDGAEIASRLILELCGGEPSELVSAGAPPPRRPSISYRPTRVESLGGVGIEESRQQQILAALGFGVRPGQRDVNGAERWEVTAPTFRPDISSEACLVEELLRVQGYGEIPVTPTSYQVGAVSTDRLPLFESRRYRAERVLAAGGYQGCVTFSFISDAEAEHFGVTARTPRLANPISQDLKVLRPSILPSLLSVAKRNVARGSRDLKLSEVGPVFFGHGPDAEERAATGVLCGHAVPRHWQEGQREFDFFDAKRDLELLLQAFRIAPGSVEWVTPGPRFFHPGRSAELRCNGKLVGYIGELHPRVRAAFDLDGRVAAFELYLERLTEGPIKREHLALAPLQAVQRDLAFVVDRSLPAADLCTAVAGAGIAALQSVRPFDCYTGTGIAEDKKSIALELTFQPVEKAFRDTELNEFLAKVTEVVGREVGGMLRS